MTHLNEALASFSLCFIVACGGDPDSTAMGEAGSDGELGETGASGDSDTEEGDDPPPDMGTEPDPNEMIPPFDEEGCHAIYAQDLLPTFELTIHPVVWELLQDQWNNGVALEEMGLDPKTYHPLEEFRYGDILIEDAEIRLRGNATYWDPLPGDKMQFQIGFHQNDPESGHFLGLRRLAFDAATFNRHLLRDRLALSIMRDAGIAAPCANNARLVINGEYYGIFTNIEKLDEAFLERVFDDPRGDLWKRANWELKTNLDTATSNRLDALEDAASAEEVHTYLVLEQALRVYAAESIIPDSDGAWAGGLNYYLYDEPLSGKFWLLPWDLDNSFERFNGSPEDDYPLNPDPVVWEKNGSHGRPWYDLALDDPLWFGYYITLIDEMLHTAYETDKLHTKIDEWSAQIEDAVFEDTNKPYDNELYLTKVEELKTYVAQRYTWVDEWLVCWKNGGETDAEGYCTPP